MIDTGGSVVSLLHALPPLHPREVNIIATHAVFSGDAPAQLTALHEAGLLNRLIVTDTVYCPDDKAGFIPFLETVCSTTQSARILHRIVTNKSMAELLTPFTAEQYLSRPRLF
jgi:ribose-phosphate pyrophosphokinase